MESLKKIEDICHKDPRNDCFVVIDLVNPGVVKERTLEDLHNRADQIRLHAGVPEEIRSHFETARNLIIYSWFYYPFNVTAQLSAYTTVEYAIRVKTQDRRTNFSVLLKRAVDQGWITDEGFPHVKRRREAIKESNEGLRPSPESKEVRAYCDTLAEALPYLRNQLAHGTSMLHEQGAAQVRICADLINQLFPEPSYANS